MPQKKLVPVTEEDKKKSYYKYYLEDMVDAPPEHYEKVLRGPIDPAKALPIQERNRLFEPGYFEEEIGYCVMPDGTGYVSNLVKMPGVTAEMFDWWFAWHGLDNLRYTIWDREDHYRAESMQKEKGRNPFLSYKERYWDTIISFMRTVVKDLRKLLLILRILPILALTYQKIGTPACSTIVCANGVMCHFLRDIEGGFELRTRFWMGWAFKNGKLIKTIPDGVRMPEAP